MFLWPFQILPHETKLLNTLYITSELLDFLCFLTHIHISFNFSFLKILGKQLLKCLLQVNSLQLNLFTILNTGWNFSQDRLLFRPKGVLD